MFAFKKDRKKHWERVYKNSSPLKVGWYQKHPEMSLRLIASTGVDLGGRIIDIGGGTSNLPAILIDRGYTQISVLDISAAAIEKAKLLLQEKAKLISWYEADVTTFQFSEQYDLWHDRAVFHFLTKSGDRKAYISALNRALRSEGYLVISTFGMDAPRKCSGLKVARYTPDSLHKALGYNYDLLNTFDEIHLTPSNIRQHFIYCLFIKKD